jgi:hypothetical protein
MKTKHIFIFFLFFLAGNLLPQNVYERMNGVFEGSKGNYSFSFEVYQNTISINGDKSDPVFTVYRVMNNRKIALTKDVYPENGNTFSPDKGFTLYTTGMNRTGGRPLLNTSFKQGSTPKDDTYEITKFSGPPIPGEPFSTVILKRVK